MAAAIVSSACWAKAVYRAHVLEGKSADEVAVQFGIAKNLVGQIKFRVDKAVAIIEEEIRG